MKVLIIEDEIPAAERLTRYLGKCDPDIEVVKVTQSISDSLKWLADSEGQLDLILADIQLTDGLSFEIFSKLDVEIPVIFVTAYDEYALDAFRVHSIDYLLKPVTFSDLSRALSKVEQMRKVLFDKDQLKGLAEHIGRKTYKSRFLVRLNKRIYTIPSDVIQCFYAEGRTVFLVTAEKKRYLVDFRLMQLEEILDPTKFYRVNRTYIVQFSFIMDVSVISNSRLSIRMKSFPAERVVVSRERVETFKSWLEGG